MAFDDKKASAESLQLLPHSFLNNHNITFIRISSLLGQLDCTYPSMQLRQP